MRVLTFRESVSFKLFAYGFPVVYSEIAQGSFVTLYGDWVFAQARKGLPYFTLSSCAASMAVTPDYVEGQPMHMMSAEELVNKDQARFEPNSVMLATLSIEPGKANFSWDEWRSALESFLEWVFIRHSEVTRIEVNYSVSGGAMQRSFHDQHALDEAFPGGSGRLIALP